MTGFRLEQYAELPSTSDLCIARAKAGEPAGLAIIAATQTAGRGSRGRGWTAPPGNLNLSLLLRPSFRPADAGIFSLLTGIAVAEAIETLLPSGIAPTLKWPNDVLLNGAKLAGILIDAAPLSHGLDWLVIGIGINLRHAPEIPGRVTTTIAAHRAASAGDIAAVDAAHAVLDRLAAWLTTLETTGPAAIHESWLACAHPIGTELTIRTPQSTVPGTFAGLSPAGELLLRVENRIERFNTGEILLRPRERKNTTMLLVIDAGNTNIVFAVHDGAEWRGTWRLATSSQRTSDEYGVWLEALLARAGIKTTQIHSAIIGTVVPAALYHLRRLCRDWFDSEPLVARAALDWGFEIRIDNPDEVGADRLLNALAAHNHYRGPLVVVDFGTATTFDVVNRDGAYLGGVISPGINLSIEALHQAAARLPRIGIGRPQSVIGRSTIPAMRSGIYWGYIGLIEGLLSRIEAEFGEPLKAIATGGLSSLFAEGTNKFTVIDHDLTLDGLRLLSLRNTAPPLPRDRARFIDTE